MLEPRIMEGLLSFGRKHPDWRFSLRSANFHYTKKWLSSHPIDGVIAVIDANKIAGVLRRSGIPCVQLLPGRITDRLPVITADNDAIGRMGAEYFLEKGFHKFAFCGIGMPWSTERQEGYLAHLSDSGLSACCFDIPFNSPNEWGFPPEQERAFLTWLKKLPIHTALLVAHDSLANVVVDLCLQNQIRIPYDLAVLSVGDHDILCKVSPVEISSIYCNIPLMAYKAAESLERMMCGEIDIPSQWVKPLTVRERRSTETIAYDDKLVADVITYIRGHACEKITVDDLLREFPVSRRTLYRKLMQYIGCGPAEEIARTRLNKACELLKESALALTQVALCCGYSDLAHMCHCFRTHLNTTPAQVRRSVAEHG